MAHFGGIVYNHPNGRIVAVVLDPHTCSVVDKFGHYFSHGKTKQDYLTEFQPFQVWMSQHIANGVTFKYDGPKLSGGTRRNPYGPAQPYDPDPDTEAFVEIMNHHRGHLGGPVSPSVNQRDRGVIEVVYEIPSTNHDDYVIAGVIAHKTFVGTSVSYAKMISSLRANAIYKNKMTFIQIFTTKSQKAGKIGFATFQTAKTRFDDPPSTLAAVKASLSQADQLTYGSFLRSGASFP